MKLFNITNSFISGMEKSQPGVVASEVHYLEGNIKDFLLHKESQEGH